MKDTFTIFSFPDKYVQSNNVLNFRGDNLFFTKYRKKESKHTDKLSTIEQKIHT